MQAEDEIVFLRKQLAAKDKELSELKKRLSLLATDDDCGQVVEKCSHTSDVLDNASITRYSRQLILPQLGPGGQLKLKGSSVLVVGAGGLGCPSAVYLAAAGVGRLGIVDYDEVELSNLHRQVLHTESRVGMAKSLSIAQSCFKLNSSVECIPYQIALSSSNALDIIKDYDVIIDATDNVATRYLLNDACVLSGKPLVSGSALRFEGQLTVYNYKNGPCYRCLYPNPPPPETVTNCSDGGVLGVVPGIIGVIQALEVIKIITDIGDVFSERLLLFDALSTNFRTIRIRGRQQKCKVCGESPSIVKLIDYEQFCGSSATDKSKTQHILNENERITVEEYHEILLRNADDHVLVDVRLPVETDICKIKAKHGLNIPMALIKRDEYLKNLKSEISQLSSNEIPVPVYVVCHLGNDSQKAVRILQEVLPDSCSVKDIKGGLSAWAQNIDKDFPVY